MVNINTWQGVDPYFLFWFDGDWGTSFVYFVHNMNPCTIDMFNTETGYYNVHEDFKYAIEEFLEDEEIIVSHDKYVELKISNIDFDDGQQTFPELGYDYFPYYTYDINFAHNR